MALIFFVQIVTQALLHYFSTKYRGRKGLKALFYADNDRLEFIWTIIPVIVLRDSYCMVYMPGQTS